MAIYINQLVAKLNNVFPLGHPASAQATKTVQASYNNPTTGTNTVIKTGSIFEQGLNNI